MTATDELRRMLDERGVEWWQSVNMLGCVFTRWYSPLFSDEVVAMENGDGELELFSHLMTPEQAVAATLGSFSCTNDCTNGERTRACLPHFWTHDGVLHIEATRMPTRIVVCEGGTCEFVPKRELDASEAENANLRERITTQKQTIQAYRDESREWREVAECAQAENAKLRELVDFMTPIAWYAATERERDRMRELGADA